MNPEGIDATTVKALQSSELNLINGATSSELVLTIPPLNNKKPACQSDVPPPVTAGSPCRRRRRQVMMDFVRVRSRVFHKDTEEIGKSTNARVHPNYVKVCLSRGK